MNRVAKLLWFVEPDFPIWNLVRVCKQGIFRNVSPKSALMFFATFHPSAVQRKWTWLNEDHWAAILEAIAGAAIFRSHCFCLGSTHIYILLYIYYYILYIYSSSFSTHFRFGLSSSEVLAVSAGDTATPTSVILCFLYKWLSTPETCSVSSWCRLIPLNFFSES